MLLTRAFAFYFELINLAETNHRKRRRIGAASERARRGGSAGRWPGRCARCGAWASVRTRRWTG